MPKDNKRRKKTAAKKSSEKNRAYDPDEIYVLQEPEPIYTLSPVQKINKIKSGISKKELTSMKEVASLDYDTLSGLLAVGRATLLNKKGNDKFNNAISERILTLADLYSYGYKVFGSTENFNSWMKEPNIALSNQPPLALADTILGIQEIKNIIGRIEYGVYS